MNNSSTLSIIVKLIDDASAQMQSVGDKIKAVGGSISSAGKTLTTDISLPIAGVAIAATTMASQYEDAMLKIQTGAGASADEVSKLSQTFLQMASSGAQQTPLQLAQGMYYVESAGFHGADAMNVLKAAMDGANVSGIDLNTVTQQLATVMNATQMPAAKAQDIMALLNATVGQGVMTMQDLIGAMSTGIIPKATSVGLTIKDVSAALDTMTQNGVPAQDAATRLGMTFSLMEAPSTKAKKALESIGITSTQLADEMRSKGLIAALQDLQNHLQASGESATKQAQLLSDVFGGGRTSGAALLLLQHLNEMKTAYNGLDASAQQFTGYVQAQGETTEAYFNRMKAAASSAAIQLGNALAPLEADVLPKLVTILTDVVQWFVKLPKPVQEGIIIFAALVAGIGPLLVIIGSMITAIGTIITVVTAAIPVITAVGAAILGLGAPLILVIAGVIALAVVVYTHWNQIINWTSNMMLTVASIWNKGWGDVSKFFTTIWSDIKTGIQDAISFITNLLNQLFSVVSGITNKIMGPISTITNAIGSVAHGIGSSVGGFLSGTIKAFASGGIVNGPTLAMVGEAGPEAIIPLSAFNSGGLAGAGAIGGGGNLVINLNGPISDRNTAMDYANIIAKELQRQLKLKNYS